MPKYILNHFVHALHTDTIIDGNKKPDLYDAAFRQLQEIKEAFRPFGATVVFNDALKTLSLKTFTDDELKRIQDANDAYDIQSAYTQRRYDYKHSVCLYVFRRSLAEEMEKSGKEIWMRYDEVDAAVSQAYDKSFETDGAAMRKRIEVILRRLVDDGWIQTRIAGGVEEWRGTNSLFVHMDRNKLRDFEKTITDALSQAGHVIEAQE